MYHCIIIDDEEHAIEGLKAYKHKDGSIKTFRPKSNAARFAKSAKRMAMPEIPEELFV